MRDDNKNSFTLERDTIFPKKILIDPFSFFIGGIGTVGACSVADDYYQRNSAELRQENTNDFPSSTLRSVATPIRCGIRFLLGGFIYVLTDIVILKVFERRIPFAAGVVTGLFAVRSSRSGVFLGCTLGLALFCHIAEFVVAPYR